MITRENLIRGEGELVEGDNDIGLRKRISQSEKMASEGLSQNEREFKKTFFSMSEMVKVLYDDYLEQKKHDHGEASTQKREGGGDTTNTPLDSPSSPSSSSSSSSISTWNTTSTRKHYHSHKHKPDVPLLKLDVKKQFPMYDGEVDAEKIDNWVR
jgi:hypothetical protein